MTMKFENDFKLKAQVLNYLSKNATTLQVSVSENDIAAFIDGKLTGQKRAEVIRALNNNQALLERVIASFNLNKASKPLKKTVRLNWLQKVKAKLILPTIGGSAAVAYAFYLFVLTPNLTSDLSQSYNVLTAANIKGDTHSPFGTRSSSPAEFLDAITHSEISAGIDFAKRKLAGVAENNHVDKETPMFILGQWLYLNHMACSSKMSINSFFWVQQHKLIQDIAKSTKVMGTEINPTKSEVCELNQELASRFSNTK